MALYILSLWSGFIAHAALYLNCSGIHLKDCSVLVCLQTPDILAIASGQLARSHTS
jgi:hypothetical protein